MENFGFNAYYNTLFKARWESLKCSLFLPPSYVMLQDSNSKNKEGYFLDIASLYPLLSLPLDAIRQVGQKKQEEEGKEERKEERGKKGGGIKVLDLCAAPGGKTLLLSHLLNTLHKEYGVEYRIQANDASVKRAERLKANIKEYATEEVQKRISFSTYKGEKCFTRWQSYFHLILLDAPCSSERHVIQSDRYLKEWSASRIKRLSIEEYSLLSSAYLMAKEGSFILYSTCSLTPLECDKVVFRAIKRHGDLKLLKLTEEELKERVLSSYEYVKESIRSGSEDKEGGRIKDRISSIVTEETECGFNIYPDKNGGAGPIYFSILQKEGKY